MKSVSTVKAKVVNVLGKTQDTEALTNLDVKTMIDNENQDRSNLSLVQLIELNKKEKELEENLSVYTSDQNVKVKKDIEKMKKIDKFFEQANQPYSGV